jgi:hypothetical protein
MVEEGSSISMKDDLADAQESWKTRDPALRATFAAFTLEDGFEGMKSVFATTRSTTRTKTEEKKESEAPAAESAAGARGGIGDDSKSVVQAQESTDAPDTYSTGNTLPDEAGEAEGKLDALEPTGGR